MTERIRGRKGVELRKHRLRKEPLCRHCYAKGIVKAADEVDHILPLANGGTDTDDNVQSLCHQCHAIKTAGEAAQGFGASNHPDWLKPSAIPLTIVCGPPASGKTTYTEDRAHSTDMVIDLDAIALSIDPSYQPWTGMLKGEFLDQAIRVRNSLLGHLSRAKTGAAWFIVSAPTQAERDWWQSKLGGSVVLMNTPSAECKRRAMQRGTPQAAKGIDDWFRMSRSRWEPKGKVDTFADDGHVVW